MKINKKTRISTLIKENEKTIEAIGSINKNFLKLKSPILRKVLAPRVNIADAAKVGGVTLEVLVTKLENIGFEFENELKKTLQESTKKIVKKSTSPSMNNINIILLDVRPILDSGKDPFGIIMKAIKKLKDNETLQIINSFAPTPLIRKLQEKGYDSWSEHPKEGVVYTFFKKQ